MIKFSVAVRMRLPDAVPPGALVAAGALGVGVSCGGCSTVAGRPIRRRSVARGHSNYIHFQVC